MKGHGYAKQTLRDMLATHVPLFLAAYRDAGVTVLDPGDYVLTDTLPMTGPNPVVLVSSTSSSLYRVTSADMRTVALYDYALTVAVLVSSSSVVGDEVAAVGMRDAILLAVRECLIAESDLAVDAEVVAGSFQDEQTGPSEMLDQQRRPMSIGSVDLTVRVAETLTVLAGSDGGTITGYDDAYAAHDASEVLT